MIKISVIMPVYNGQKYIKETIESVLNQTFIDFEFIIIDDGSTDNTLNIIESYLDERIKIIKQNHGGIIKALNRGLDEARGDYIVRIDADDICMLNRFEVLIDYMDNNQDVLICGSWANKIDQNGKIIGEFDYLPIEYKDIKKYALIHNPFIHPSIIFRKDIIEKVGKYKNYKHNEDYELWTRILKLGKGHNISEKLIKYRIHENQVTKKFIFKMILVGLWVRLLSLIRLSF